MHAQLHQIDASMHDDGWFVVKHVLQGLDDAVILCKPIDQLHHAHCRSKQLDPYWESRHRDHFLYGTDEIQSGSPACMSVAFCVGGLLSPTPGVGRG